MVWKNIASINRPVHHFSRFQFFTIAITLPSYAANWHFLSDFPDYLFFQAPIIILLILMYQHSLNHPVISPLLVDSVTNKEKSLTDLGEISNRRTSCH